jgi:predicted HD phosphohydrolase
MEVKGASMYPTIDDLFTLLSNEGEAWYAAEPVTHRQHALQCAWLAECAGESSEMIIACLFHDIGLLINPIEDGEDEHGPTDHDLVGTTALRRIFSENVLAPIRLHSTARRHLAGLDETYLDRCSPSARREINHLGGPLIGSQSMVFRCMAGAEEAILLCHYDDLARIDRASTPDLDYFKPLAQRLAARAQRVRTEIPA